MVWHIIRYWVSVIIPVFYKKLQAHNTKNLNVKGPVIVAMNHPNAFTDPVAITMVCYPPKLKYMARGDAFKPGFVTWVLEAIGIVPIFRIQDGGKEGLQKNDEAYRRVNEFLKKNNKVIIFAEGVSTQERRLRPLKKGVARMVFGAYEYLGHDKLMVVPVGVNYSKADKFRSNLFYNIGEPIYIKDFMQEYAQNPARAYNKFLARLEPRMKELITHIDKPGDDDVVYMIEQMTKKDRLKDLGLSNRSLKDQLVVQKEITEKVNKASAMQNPALEEFRVAGRQYFSLLEKHRLRDWLINPRRNRQPGYFTVFGRGLFLLLFSPLYLLGLIGNYLPLRLVDYCARKITRKPEFYASMAIAFGMALLPVNYLLWFFIPYIFSETIFYPLLICFGLIISGVFSLYYHPYLQKTLGMARILWQSRLANDLKMKRGHLMELINKF